MGARGTTRLTTAVLVAAGVALLLLGTLQLVGTPADAGSTEATAPVSPRPAGEVLGPPLPATRTAPTDPADLAGPGAQALPVTPVRRSRPTSPTGGRRATRASWRPAPPLRVAVPALGIDAAVVPITAAGDRLTPPDDPRLLGWWSSGARAGDRRGATLVAGHTVHDGGGALDHLEDVRRGARIVVRASGVRLTYQVARVRTLSKAAVARHSERLFAQDVSGRLVLVTCEGWDGTGYRSNVVVTARLVRATVHAAR